MFTAHQIITLLDLKPLPMEGGYYRETYRSDTVIPAEALSRYDGSPRACSTAIYYLLTPSVYSALHRLPSDEMYHFYYGDAVEMLQLCPSGKGRIVTIGNDLTRNQQPQVLVPRGVWQGSRILPGGSYALLGTTVAPGFEFADFEAAKRSALLQQYPEFRDHVISLTKPE